MIQSGDLVVPGKGNVGEILFPRVNHGRELCHVDGLGLEAANVAFDRQGVEVNDFLQTSNPRIYAAGDICSSYKFTHAADFMARAVIQNAFFGFAGKKRMSSLTIPWCTYSDPEIAHVGMYEKDAREKGLEVDKLTIPLADVDRAVLDGEDEGFLRLYVEKGKDRILGATLVAEHAGDMLGELSLAVTTGVGLNAISGVIHAYPTQAEVIKKAADTWRRGKLTPMVKKIFSLFFKIFS